MSTLQRIAGIAILLALAATLTLSAQDSDIQVVGSGIIMPAIEAWAASSDAEISLATTVTGTDAGLEQFCDGLAEMTVANRAISVEEDAACLTNDIEYVEVLVGHSVMAFITNPENGFLQCLNTNELDLLLAPSSTESILTWDQVNPDYDAADINVVVPPVDTLTYAILDDLVVGAGFRNDIIQTGDAAAAVDAVLRSDNTLAVVNLADLEPDAARTVLFQFTESPACSEATVPNFESRLYTGGQRLFLYVNRSLLEQDNVNEWLAYINSEDNAEALTTLGLLPASSSVQEINLTALTDEEVGRQFSQDIVTFEIPPVLAGQINIGGSANAFAYVNQIITRFTSAQENLTITPQFEGEIAGLRRLCNGELDIALTTDGVDDAAAANCAANNITTVEFSLGQQVVVMLANAEADYAACLTSEQILNIWGAQSTETVMNWQDVDSSFPDQEMLLFGLPEGNQLADVLLTQATGEVIPVRVDTEQDFDPLYRAAATANVPGAITYMSWNDYQRVLDNEQQNIQLVAVDAGDGCITPEADTIENGSYPLTLPAAVVFNQSALTDIAVQSFAWSMFTNENYPSLANAGFTGVEFGDLPELRDQLQLEFALAAEAAANAPEPAPEATTEPEAEATDEPQDE